MDNVICNPDGSIDWNANGWPEPNPGAETMVDGYSTNGMPSDIFDMWMDECDELETGWSIDW
jgi:hypothetical protein